MVVEDKLGIVFKRDGRGVPFDPDRITSALDRCFSALGREPSVPTVDLTGRVVHIVRLRAGRTGLSPSVEGIQDVVEVVLQAAGEFEAAKAYILYRAEHQKLRVEKPIPQHVVEAFAASDSYFPTQLQKFQFYDKYSRFSYELGRRETWLETVDRTCNQLWRLAQPYGGIDQETMSRVYAGIAEMKSMPSMRLLAMAGPAFERDNATQYNCTYLPVDGPEAWVEGMLLSMAGCGVGFSVEREYVEQFPRVRRQQGKPPATLVVEDSSTGWADALRFGVDCWMGGLDARFDFGLIRPHGTPLKIKGGRASGPAPLERLLSFTRSRILARQGSFLRTLDAHDIMCAVGSAAVSGGVRRTAMISLFDADDLNMAQCKSGNFELENSQRWNANNSAVWTDLSSLDQPSFMRQWLTMVESGRGEPGIFSRAAAEALMPARRSRDYVMGSNPCGEIILRPWGMCNLTTVPARSDDDLPSLAEKVRLATIIGTIQSLGTHFPNLRPQWAKNAEEERLLGVSIGGQMDCPLLTGHDGPRAMQQLRKVAVEANEEWAWKLGINRSAAITCVKPDGNSSQLLDMSSGIHPRWAPYYIRNVRVSSSSALARVLLEAGVPMSPENGDDPVSPRTWVASFPVAAPAGSTTRGDLSAVLQCEHWLRNKVNWTEHNPSVTITYQPGEVIELMSWVWDHREVVGGMAFLPASDAQYNQLPYIEVTGEEYGRRAAEFPVLDFSKVYRYEAEDMTTAAQELACSAGLCEV